MGLPLGKPRIVVIDPARVRDPHRPFEAPPMRLPRVRFTVRRMLIALAVLAVPLGLFGLFAVYVYATFPRADQGQMLSVVYEWGRLAPIPSSAKGLRVTTEGSMFTRGFRASFSAPGPVIERWLRESPGTREAEIERPSPSSRKYVIEPGGGAQHAEVTVDEDSGIVSIYVYWS
jgi:hypothetical protein